MSWEIRETTPEELQELSGCCQDGEDAGPGDESWDSDIDEGGDE